ncbi:hypothetical protein EGW08_019485 [Elysia chlorotica]|uniref:Ig-like domain-containing protein n=1 Tax=Elysia chlorotica TaxID=188477 RepID=A0A3S1B1K6_ELYCH|nr:hypothetical protein EGW08_019485 [Elysia chlorotica]
METRWTIRPCGGSPITVCDRLEVYALPENPSCTVREEPDSGDTRSVTVSCSTSKVYPRAECRFYSKTDNGKPVQINNQITYSHPEISGTPVYYRSECSVTVEVKDLGEGTHSFTGYIYPGVTGGYTLVGGSDGDKTVTLSFPQASHSCDPQMVQGYFTEESSTCTCSLNSVGYPRGTAQWYQGDQRVGSGGILVVTHDRASSYQKTYTCEGESSLGRRTGSTLTPNFAFLYKDSVVVESTSDTINICDNNNNYQVQVTCRISKENVNPAPSFSFSRDGTTYDAPQSGTVSGDGGSYQRQTSLSPDAGGGKYQVFCRVTNTVTNTREVADTFITFREPPPGPPQITVKGQPYQGLDTSNTITLVEGDTEDVTCRVEGGYPAAHTTRLQCGQIVQTGDGNTATVSFTRTGQPLTREMNGDECTCTAQHASGCYANKETKLKLNVLYAPDVTFTVNSADRTFSKGDNLEFKCSAQGNPDPTMTLTRKETSEDLKTVQTGELTHTLSLDCLDTGVYVCSGQNSQKTTREEISISVRCPQKLIPTLDPDPQVNAVIGMSAEFGVEIYGYPEPSSLYLQAVNDATDLSSSPRHTVVYTAGLAPFGTVNVTISDLVASDYTNYTLTVDNGEGQPLVYSFYLNEVNATKVPDTGDGGGGSAVIIGVCVAVAVLLILGLVAAVLVLKRKGIFNKQNRPSSSENGFSRQDSDYCKFFSLYFYCFVFLCHKHECSSSLYVLQGHFTTEFRAQNITCTCKACFQMV